MEKDPVRKRDEIIIDAVLPPCSSCGNTSWKPSRRELVGNAVISVMAVSSLGIVSSSAKAIPTSSSLLTHPICDQLYDSCVKNIPEDANDFQRSLALFMCGAERVACEAEQARQALLEAIQAALQWIAEHPEVVIGTIIVIGVITLVVIACGGPQLTLCVAVAAFSLA